jgi:hypothetical protein
MKNIEAVTRCLKSNGSRVADAIQHARTWITEFDQKKNQEM